MRSISHRLFALLALCISALVIAAAGASADSASPDGFSFTSAHLSVDENAGNAVITVQRGGSSLPAGSIHYHTPPLASQTAIHDSDYKPVNGVLNFAAGQATATFEVPIVDHQQANSPSKTFYVALYGPVGGSLGPITKAEVTIVDTDTTSLARTPGNPLGLASTPPASNELEGAKVFVDKVDGTAAIEARKHPKYAKQLDVIARQPIATRFVASNTKGGAGLAVNRFLERVDKEQPGTVPEISTYRLIHEACASAYKSPGHGRYADDPGKVKSYEDWIRSFAAGIGSHPAIVFLEIDGLITTTCLGPTGLNRRVEELSYAIDQLSALPRTAVYVDAGAGDALPAATAAKLLNRIGVQKIQGFFLNATHYDFTSKEIAYGEKVSKLTDGAHFVVNTAVNGRGPLKPHNRVKNGNEVRCNPAGRGLGPKPTFDTGYKNVDAFAWIGNPGLSTGTCGDPKKNPPTGVFDLPYALSLVRNAVFRVR